MPPQEVITADNVVVSVDAVVYYEATDPQRLVYNVADFFTAHHQARPDQPPQPDRRPRARQGAHVPRHDQHPAPRGARRRHRQVGCAGGPRRDPAHRSAAGHRVGDARPDACRARPSCHRHRGQGLPGGGDRPCRRRAAGSGAVGAGPQAGRRSSTPRVDAQAIELRASADKLRLELIGEGEGNAAKARLTGIKEADADKNVLTVEYLQALETHRRRACHQAGDPGRVLRAARHRRCARRGDRPDDTDDEVRPKDGLPIPDDDERVDLPRAEPIGDPAILMRRVDAPQAGWYPDPESRAACAGGTASTGPTRGVRLRARPSCCRSSSARRSKPPIGTSRRRWRAPPKRVGAPRVGSRRPDSQQIVDEVRRAARRRSIGPRICSRSAARQMQRDIVPLVSEYTNRLVSWIRVRCHRRGRAARRVLRVPGGRSGEPVRVDRRPHRQLHRRPDRRRAHIGDQTPLVIRR